MSWGGVSVPLGTLAPHLESLFHAYSFTSCLEEGSYAWDSFSEWAAITDGAIDLIERQLNGSVAAGLAAAERDALAKLPCSWRAVGLGSLLEKEDLVTRNKAQARALRPYLRRLGQAYVGWIKRQQPSELQRMYDGSVIDLGKGKGAPYFFSGADRQGLIAMQSLAQRGSDFHTVQDAICSAGGARVPFSIVVYRRVQGASKKRNEITYGPGGELVESDQLSSIIRPKCRRIQSVPAVMHVALSGLATVLLHAVRAIEPSAGGAYADAVRMLGTRDEALLLATDLKQYDDSVASETIDAYSELVVWPCLAALERAGACGALEAHRAASLDHALNTLPVYGPPSSLSAGARVYRKSGRTTSGGKLTSRTGTDLNLCRVLYLADMIGVRPRYSLAGDDTILAFRVESDRERWLRDAPDINAAIGFTETVGSGPTFLMKYVPLGCALVTRMVGSVIQKEVQREPRDMLTAALGMKSRIELLKGHPFGHVFEDVVRTLLNEDAQTALTLAQNLTWAELAAAYSAGPGRRAVERARDNAVEAYVFSSTGGLSQEEAYRMLFGEADSSNRFTTYGALRTTAAAIGTREAERALAKLSYTQR